MKLKLLGFVFAVALILAFIDVGLVPILVNRHDESRTDVVYQYQSSEKNETGSVDYSALANAIQGFLMDERGLTNVSWRFSATRHYSNEESWSSWIPLENYSSYISSLNYTPCRVEFSPPYPSSEFFQNYSGAFRVSSVSRVYLYTELTMVFFSTYTVAVENDAWLWASLFFNALIIASTVLFCVQNNKIKESE